MNRYCWLQTTQVCHSTRSTMRLCCGIVKLPIGRAGHGRNVRSVSPNAGNDSCQKQAKVRVCRQISLPKPQEFSLFLRTANLSVKGFAARQDRALTDKSAKRQHRRWHLEPEGDSSKPQWDSNQTRSPRNTTEAA
jgi:hypothetical protein